MYTQELNDGRLWLREVENVCTVGSTVTLYKLQFVRIRHDCMGNNYTTEYTNIPDCSRHLYISCGSAKHR
jgi:hypothetical protein